MLLAAIVFLIASAFFVRILFGRFGSACCSLLFASSEYGMEHRVRCVCAPQYKCVVKGYDIVVVVHRLCLRSHIKMTMSHRHCFAQAFRACALWKALESTTVQSIETTGTPENIIAQKRRQSTDSSVMEHKKKQILRGRNTLNQPRWIQIKKHEFHSEMVIIMCAV